MEASNFPDTEIKNVTMRIIKKLSENFNKKLPCVKKRTEKP